MTLLAGRPAAKMPFWPFIQTSPFYLCATSEKPHSPQAPPPPPADPGPNGGGSAGLWSLFGRGCLGGPRGVRGGGGGERELHRLFQDNQVGFLTDLKAVLIPKFSRRRRRHPSKFPQAPAPLAKGGADTAAPLVSCARHPDPAGGDRRGKAGAREEELLLVSAAQNAASSSSLVNPYLDRRPGPARLAARPAATARLRASCWP